MKKFIIILLLSLFICFVIYSQINKSEHFFPYLESPNNFNKKIAIIFPFREQIDQNRGEHLKYILDYYKKLNLNFDIYIIEQGNDDLFNKGILLNAGHDIIKKSGINYDNEIHHDIDWVPDNKAIEYFFSDQLVAAVKGWDRVSTGGIVVVPFSIMDKVNGYSNRFSGWGSEDDNFGARLYNNDIKIFRPKYGKYKNLEHIKSTKIKGLENKKRHNIYEDELLNGFNSGLSDLKYEIIKKEIISDKITKYTIDF